MNTIRMTPLANALNEATWNGLSQLRLGVRCPAGAVPPPTLTSATTDSTTSMTSSIDSSTFWKFADTSMPT